jgi:polyvinyl alcohol dehydrogenase (cytochrome)
LYLGTQQGAWFLAIDARTGSLIWKTQLDTVDPYAVVTTSASVAGPLIVTGVASTQEGNAAGAPGTANGSVVALNALTGNILWKTHTTVTGYSGAGVWGSNPVVDLLRGTVYIGTGDNYTAPTDPAYLSCVSGGGTAATCQSPDNHVDSILALDLLTGKIKWSQRMVTWPQDAAQNGSDFFNLSCVYKIPGCPSPAGPDFDFGSAPNEITFLTPSGFKTIIGAGQKSGIYYAFDPDTGNVLWQTQVGPGSSLGGMEWGSATDGQRIYVAVANMYGIPYAAGSAGSWAALDPATGKILWQVADPNDVIDLGPLTVANGVVYVPSMAGGATAPNMIALNAATGNTLWSFASGGSTIAGATVVNGMVYWGSGYTHLPLPGFIGSNTFYAFSLNGK